MNDMTGNLAPGETAIAPREDYLATVEAYITLSGHTAEIPLDLHGHYLSGIAGTHDQQEERGGFVIDAVMIGKRDVSRELAPEVLETLTTYLNEVM